MHVSQSALCPQRVSLHTFFQVCGQGCGHSVMYCDGESQAVEALDLPAPTCFRSRSHSYLRAIQAGCSQDEDTASVDSDSPPPTAAVYSYCTDTSEYQRQETELLDRDYKKHSLKERKYRTNIITQHIHLK